MKTQLYRALLWNERKTEENCLDQMQTPKRALRMAKRKKKV